MLLLVKVGISFSGLCTKGKVNKYKHIVQLPSYNQAVTLCAITNPALFSSSQTDHLPLQTWPGAGVWDGSDSINQSLFLYQESTRQASGSQTSHQNTAINNKIHCDWIDPEFSHNWIISLNKKYISSSEADSWPTK